MKIEEIAKQANINALRAEQMRKALIDIYTNTNDSVTANKALEALHRDTFTGN